MTTPEWRGVRAILERRALARRVKLRSPYYAIGTIYHSSVRITAMMLVLVAIAVAGLGSQPSPAIARARTYATPIPQASQTPPPDVAATPTPQPLNVTGELIDLERGYIVFASGDAFRLATDCKTLDAATRAAPSFPIVPGLYALAMLDRQSALVTMVLLSRKPLPGGTPAAEVPRQFVAESSSPKPNPDLQPPRGIYPTKLSGSVSVGITVEVPPETPLTDDVYMATDTSGWNPQAIKMERIDGRHFRIQVDLAGGTEMHYLFTRGSWTAVERDRAGLQRPARRLFVPGGEAMAVDATVDRWADIP